MLATLVMVMGVMVTIMVKVGSSAVDISVIMINVTVANKVCRASSSLLSKMWCNTVISC